MRRELNSGEGMGWDPKAVIGLTSGGLMASDRLPSRPVLDETFGSGTTFCTNTPDMT